MVTCGSVSLSCATTPNTSCFSKSYRYARVRLLPYRIHLLAYGSSSYKLKFNFKMASNYQDKQFFEKKSNRFEFLSNFFESNRKTSNFIDCQLVSRNFDPGGLSKKLVRAFCCKKMHHPDAPRLKHFALTTMKTYFGFLKRIIAC